MGEDWGEKSEGLLVELVEGVVAEEEEEEMLRWGQGGGGVFGVGGDELLVGW